MHQAQFVADVIGGFLSAIDEIVASITGNSRLGIVRLASSSAGTRQAIMRQYASFRIAIAVKATQKSGKADAVIWRTNKSEARALLQLDVDLEDAGIETGRGKDYQKPIRTDFPVFNDLPAEGVLDYSWCERYQLGDDGRTWTLKPGQAPADVHHGDNAGVTI